MSNSEASNGRVMKIMDFIKKFILTYKNTVDASDPISANSEKRLQPHLFLTVSCVFLVLSEVVGIFFSGQLNALSFGSSINATDYSSIGEELRAAVLQITDGIVRHKINRSIFVIGLATLACYLFLLVPTVILGKFSKRKNQSDYSEVKSAIDQMARINVDYALAWLFLSVVTFAVEKTIPSIEQHLHISKIASLVFTTTNAIVFVTMIYRARRLQKKINNTDQKLQAHIWVALIVATTLPILLLSISPVAAKYFYPNLSFRVTGPCQKEGCFVYLQSRNYSQDLYVDGLISVPISYFPVNAASPAPKAIGRLEIRLEEKQDGGPILLEPDIEKVAKVSSITLVCNSSSIIDKQKIQAVGESDTIVYLPDQEWRYSRALFHVTPNGLLPLLFRENALPLKEEHCSS